MRLKTKLVLAATSVTFGIVLLLALLFLGELLRQRIAQTAASNDVLANEVRLATRQALETGLPQHPVLRSPVDESAGRAAARGDGGAARRRQPAFADGGHRPLLADGAGRQHHGRPRHHPGQHRSRGLQPASAAADQPRPRERRQRRLPGARALRKAARARHRRSARPQRAALSGRARRRALDLPARLLRSLAECGALVRGAGGGGFGDHCGPAVEPRAAAHRGHQRAVGAAQCRRRRRHHPCARAASAPRQSRHRAACGQDHRPPRAPDAQQGGGLHRAQDQPQPDARHPARRRRPLRRRAASGRVPRRHGLRRGRQLHSRNGARTPGT